MKQHFLFQLKIAPNKTRKNNTVDIFFARFSKEFKKRFKNIPIKTGTVTIKNILNAISKRRCALIRQISAKKR